jgi:hypothetical protein
VLKVRVAPEIKNRFGDRGAVTRTVAKRFIKQTRLALIYTVNLVA